MDAAVVIPVGSVDSAFVRQLEAVLGQSATTLRDVVLSVNSSDLKVRATVQSAVAACADSRVRVVDSSDRTGAAHARNVGASSVSCAAVAFCDADDLVHDGWLAALVTALADFDAVSGRVVDVFPQERMRRWHAATTDGELNTFLGRPYLLTGNLAIRREVFEAVGGFDESLTRCEDIAISWKLVEQGYTIGYVHGAVIDYRHRKGIAGMLRQHYAYGRGMSEVLRAFAAPRRELFLANRKHVADRSLMGAVRRCATAAGRVRGLVG